MNDSNNNISNNVNRPAHSKKPSLWGWGVVALYGGFALFILILVGYASLQNFDLVEDNYYTQGLAYQQQIDKSQAAQSLTKGLHWSFDQRTKLLKINYPDNLPLDGLAGIVSFFRPSNSSLDLFEKVKPDSNFVQEIDCSTLVKGKWKIKFDWMVGEQEYYNEDVLIVE